MWYQDRLDSIIKKPSYARTFQQTWHPRSIDSVRTEAIRWYT